MLTREEILKWAWKPVRVTYIDGSTRSGYIICDIPEHCIFCDLVIIGNQGRTDSWISSQEFSSRNFSRVRKIEPAKIKTTLEQAIEGAKREGYKLLPKPEDLPPKLTKKQRKYRSYLIVGK